MPGRVKVSGETIITGTDLLLDKWLKLVVDPPAGHRALDFCFPSQQHRDEYIATIAQRTDTQIKALLYRFLIHTGTLGVDKDRFSWRMKSRKHKARSFTEYERRLILHGTGMKGIFPWEGITWILDLLPHNPAEALSALSGYMLAHIQYLPDGRIAGLQDATMIIRAKYIGNPPTNRERLHLLLTLTPRQFEHIVEATYAGMGYATILTPPCADGGRDIHATKDAPAKHERLLIECNQWQGPVPVGVARSLLGFVADAKENKGTLVCASRFTKPALQFARDNPRLELIDGFTLAAL